jgi:hypothetical protein
LSQSSPPAGSPNPYQAPLTTSPTTAIAPQGNTRLLKVLKDFQSQIVALGGFWIIIGLVALGIAGLAIGIFSEVKNPAAPVLLAILIVQAVTFVALGILVCLKQMWAVYACLAFTYLSLINEVLQILRGAGIIWLVILVIVILQAHRVLRWAGELTRAGIPLTTGPKNLQVPLAPPA